MKRIFLAATMLLSLNAVHAQDYREPSKESEEYNHYRNKVTTPPYGLAKVKALIAGIVDSDNDETSALSPKAYAGLTLREKFTYHMIHAETYAQNCDAVPPIMDEQKKIFGEIPSPFNEKDWSSRQMDWFRDNQDSVVAIIKESALRSKRLGTNYKSVIVEMNAIEMIPFLQEFYLRDKKDHDILTIFLLFMKNNKYEPFLASVTNKKLYGERSDYGSFIDYNSANEALILQRINDFYKNRHK
ncbi:MAG: hypothetical protein JO154_01850 [Chitinophaga sp.]|uniref:hypothetical protein n=1 Tax=Chitinophaga sp. TaxID=1869181 RepID=UPI0025BDFA17|nr:hypothetical protein [Chitinophaga sp.]MBV8251323.1 hypothetical protein [Chitinophaga sp.]